MKEPKYLTATSLDWASGGCSGGTEEELATETEIEVRLRFLLLKATTIEVLGVNVKWYNFLCFNWWPWQPLRRKLLLP